MSQRHLSFLLLFLECLCSQAPFGNHINHCFTHVAKAFTIAVTSNNNDKSTLCVRRDNHGHSFSSLSCNSAERREVCNCIRGYSSLSNSSLFYKPVISNLSNSPSIQKSNTTALSPSSVRGFPVVSTVCCIPSIQ
jgi:hypothetical protein